MRSLEYHQLLANEWPQEVVIEEGILSVGDRLVIGGEPKSGKSVLVGQLIRGLCMGTDFLGFRVPRPRKVLYIQAELREGRLKTRYQPWQRWAETHEVTFPEGMFYIWSTNGALYLTGWNEHHEEKVRDEHPLDKLYKEIDEIKPEVIVFDPLTSFHEANENSSQEIKELCEIVDKIKEYNNAAVVIVHHFRKGNLTDVQAKIPLVDRIRGSGVIPAWADSIIAIYGNQNSKDTKFLEFVLRDSDAGPQRTLHYNYETRQFDWKDPRLEIVQWVIEYFQTRREVATTDFVSALLTAFADKFKGNFSLATQAKTELVQKAVLVERADARFRYLSLGTGRGI